MEVMAQAAPITSLPYPEILKETLVEVIPKIHAYCAVDDRCRWAWSQPCPCWAVGDDWSNPDRILGSLKDTIKGTIRSSAIDTECQWAWGDPCPMWTWGDDWTNPDRVLAKDHREIEKIEANVPEPTVEVAPPVPVVEQPPISILHDLEPIERLLISKRLQVKDVLILKGKKNRFCVRTPAQNMVYTIDEENRWWVGYLCYGLRPLVLRVRNQCGDEVMRIVRPYAFTGRVLPCSLQRLKVFSPPDHLIGSVEQIWTPVKPLYVVKDEFGYTKFQIQGPCITVACYNELKFFIKKPDGSTIGITSKRWQGLMHALFYSAIADKFSLSLDKALTVEEKALLLAATLLIDYMYLDS